MVPADLPISLKELRDLGAPMYEADELHALPVGMMHFDAFSVQSLIAKWS